MNSTTPSKRAFWSLFAVAAAVAVVTGGFLFAYFFQGFQSENTYEELAEMVHDPRPPVVTEAQEPSENVQQTSEDGEEVELTAWDRYRGVYDLNPDFVGWIQIEGTAIDYPVVQRKDDRDYYLRRDFFGDPNTRGVPYVDDSCRVGYSGNLVIYGHNMHDGTMFADLLKYEDKSYFTAHPVVKFDTLSGYGTYEVMAVFRTQANINGFRYDLRCNFADDEDFIDYVTACKSLSMYDTGITAEPGDSLISLSTCEYSQTDGRLVVVARMAGSKDGEEDVSHG